MADVTLSDGRALTLDLFQVTHRDHVRMAKGETSPEEDSVILARVCGLKAEELEALPHPDWRRIVTRYWEKSREPLADPN